MYKEGAYCHANEQKDLTELRSEINGISVVTDLNQKSHHSFPLVQPGSQNKLLQNQTANQEQCPSESSFHFHDKYKDS